MRGNRYDSSVTSHDHLLDRYHEDGFVILPGVLSESEVAALRAALQPYLDLGFEGRNDFEGEYTQRVYSLVGRGSVFERTAEHPTVLELVDRLLRPGYLLTASQAICIHPRYHDRLRPHTRERSAGALEFPIQHWYRHGRRLRW